MAEEEAAQQVVSEPDVAGRERRSPRHPGGIRAARVRPTRRIGTARNGRPEGDGRPAKGG